MGIADRFEKFLKAELDCRAVWPPVLTPMQLGDYGVSDGASFQRLGNITDFGLKIEVERGQPSSLNLVSAGMKQVRLAAGVAVPAFQGLGEVAGSLGIEFTRSESFLLKCRRVERTQIGNLGALALRLARARTVDGQTWKHLAWKIVWQLYTGHEVVFLATRGAGTKVDFKGSASALHQLEMGSASVGVGVQTNQSLGVQILGDTGPVGYGLARVKVIGAGVKFFGGDLEDEERDAVEPLGTDDPGLDDLGGENDENGENGEPPAHLDELALSADEPATWDEVEEAETDPRDLPEGPMMFADEPLDTRSRAHWLQSCLRRLVDPDLTVDGALGLRTRRALKQFQRQSDRLTADGVPGPRTIAALEASTGSRCPGAAAHAEHEPTAEVDTAVTESVADDAEAVTEPVVDDTESAVVEPVAEVTAPVTAPVVADAKRGEFTVRTVDKGGTAVQVVSSADDEVRFSYFTKGDAWSVCSYRGGDTGLLHDADLRARGHTAGAIKIFRANALKESRGLFGAVNTWDNQLVSWGVAQFAGRAGTLAALLASMHEDPATRPAFDRFFVANGLTVRHGPYFTRRTPAGERHVGWHVVVDTPAGQLAGDDAWSHVRRTPRLIGAFMLAGNDLSIQLAQVQFWMDHFLQNAVRKVVLRGSGGERRISDFLTSEYGLALVVRLYNWMPAYVQPWFIELSAELATRHPELDVHRPDVWAHHPALEPEFCELVKDKRRRVKRGSYDTYALELDRSRGSYANAGPAGNHIQEQS